MPGCLWSYGPGSYNLEICRLIWKVVYGAAGLLRRQLLSWWYLSVSLGILFGDTMIIFSLVILLDRIYWPGLREEVRSYLASCSICLARKSPCPRRAPMGHISVGHRWDRVAMDILDMSVSTPKGNRYVLVIVACFSRFF